jgi:hypothetical protein
MLLYKQNKNVIPAKLVPVTAGSAEFSRFISVFWAAVDSPWAVHTAGCLARQVFANTTVPQFHKSLIALT